MASIFKPPQITQQQLSSTILEYGEIVYNTGKNEFFTGNGTSGGISLFNENVPLSTSQLVNDSGFITAADVPSGEVGFPSAYISDINGTTGSVTMVDNNNIINFGAGGTAQQYLLLNWNFANLRNYLNIPQYSHASSYSELYSYTYLDYSNSVNTFLLNDNYELNTVMSPSNLFYFNDIKMFKIYNPNGYTFKFGYLDYDSNNNLSEYDQNNQRFEEVLITSTDIGVTTFIIYRTRHQAGNDVMMLNHNGQEWSLYFAY